MVEGHRDYRSSCHSNPDPTLTISLTPPLKRNQVLPCKQTGVHAFPLNGWSKTSQGSVCAIYEYNFITYNSNQNPNALPLHLLSPVKTRPA